MSKTTSEKSLNSFMGTLNWCAPEIINGFAFTKEADVYSMGLVLWEILAHEKPYSGWKIMQIHEHIRAGGLPPFPEDKICSPVYKAIIEKTLQKEAKQRPAFVWLENALKQINPNDFEIIEIHMYATCGSSHNTM